MFIYDLYQFYLEGPLCHSLTSYNLQLLGDSTVVTYYFNSILLVTILFVSPIRVIAKEKNESFPNDDIQIRTTGINGRSWLQWT